MKKIVITGGKGFFGSRFQKMWERKYQVLTPGSKELDVTNEKVVNEYYKHICKRANSFFNPTYF